jgi:hypothetical protein
MCTHERQRGDSISRAALFPSCCARSLLPCGPRAGSRSGRTTVLRSTRPTGRRRSATLPTAWGNNEKEYYTTRSENISIVKDGEASMLKITARAEAYEGSTTRQPESRPRERKRARFGRIEARVKLPRGKGVWPASWMMADSIPRVGWPACGEIDILEMARGTNDASLTGTIHWRNRSGSHEYERPVGRAYFDSGSFRRDLSPRCRRVRRDCSHSVYRR